MEKIDQFAEKLGFSLYEYQQNLLLSLLSHQKNAIISSRQLGITTMITILITYKIVHRELIDKPLNICIISPNSYSSTEIILKIRKFLDKLQIDYKATPTNINIINGGGIHIVKQNTKNLYSVDILYVDNYTYMNCLPQYDESSTYTILAATGGGYYMNNILKLKDDKTYNFISIPYTENKKFREKEWIEKTKEIIGEDLFKTEYDIDKIIEEYEANKRKTCKD